MQIGGMKTGVPGLPVDLSVGARKPETEHVGRCLFQVANHKKSGRLGYRGFVILGDIRKSQK